MLKLLKNKTFLILILIVAFGFILRIYRIWENTLYGDELTIGLDSYSLLKTGRDQLGNLLPLTFKMGAGRPAGYVYGSIPFVALFGPTVWGVRGLSLVSGLGVIILMFLLGKKLFSDKVGLTAAFLMSISPWSLSLSRGGFEANFALFLSLLGVTSFFYAKEKPKLYLISALSWGLALNTYPTYKLTLPILIIGLVFISGGVKNLISSSKYVKYAVLIGLFLSVIAYSQTFLSNSEQRFLTINAFSQGTLKELTIQEINYERNTDSFSKDYKAIPLIFHNKVEKYFTLLRDEYTKNLSADFLFLKGDANPRHNMSVSGEFYFVEIVFILLGLGYLFKKNDTNLKFISFWILVSPLAAVPILQQHALRNSFMLPPIELLSALGLMYLLKNKKYYILLLTLIIGFTQFIFILERIYFLSPNKFARFWAEDGDVAAKLAIENRANFDYIFISDRIDNAEYAYPAKARIEPNLIIKQNQKRDIVEGLEFKHFGNVYIGTLPTDLFSFATSLKGTKYFIRSYDESSPYDSPQIISKAGVPIVITKVYK